jgi:hypothetical protein
MSSFAWMMTSSGISDLMKDPVSTASVPEKGLKGKAVSALTALGRFRCREVEELKHEVFVITALRALNQ